MENEYNIGDRVYHVTPDSEIGVVVDWRYSAYSGVYSYFVTWGINDTNWYINAELSRSQVFN